MHRQLLRLEEDGWTIVRVPAAPEASVGQRLADALTPDTSAVMTSAVFFKTGRIAGGLPVLAAAARALDVPLLVDVYHALGTTTCSVFGNIHHVTGAMPFALADMDLLDAFVVGGGYKYMQLGEGVCFLRYPQTCAWRPLYTGALADVLLMCRACYHTHTPHAGWFADFESLEDTNGTQVNYHSKHGQRFVGSTVDPVSWYRAAAVFDFFQEQGMTPAALRSLYQHQLGVLRQTFVEEGLHGVCVCADATSTNPFAESGRISLDLDVPLEQLGAFLALRSPHAGAIQAALLERGVLTDNRGDVLRCGPAPYVTDEQLQQAMRELKSVVQQL